MSLPTRSNDADIRSGVLIGMIAYSMWGVFPVYFKLIAEVDPVEVLGHRILWAVPFGALILTFRSQWREVRSALVDRSMLAWLSLAAICISANWLIYIWAIQNERIFQTSLGYYINPLLYVAVGVIILGERLRRLQGVAVALALIGVVFLTINGGAFPWVALSLAGLFTVYGVIRKQIAIGAMPGLFIETMLLLPFAVAWLLYLLPQNDAAINAGDTRIIILLMIGGPITVLPLLFFAIAAKKLPLTVIGFMQFLAPTLQFIVGVYYGEPLTLANLICFGCIWSAVIVFSYDAIRAGTKKPLPA